MEYVKLIGFASMATVGIVELIKVFFPNIKSKIKALLSLIFSIGAAVGIGLLTKANTTQILISVVGTVALVQVGYDFILKLLFEKIEELKQRIADNKMYRPLYEAQIQQELKNIENGTCSCDQKE